MTQQIKKWIVEWFEENTTTNREFIVKNSGEDYFAGGWIDSFKFIKFISDIEQKFGISFSNEEFQDKTFSTIDGLSIIIKRKMV